MAVSCDSITASVPSRIALATSATSARVGREAVTIESSICVAVIDGRASVPASARSFFWTMGTSWIGSSMPRSPRATMTQSAALRIDSRAVDRLRLLDLRDERQAGVAPHRLDVLGPAHEGQRHEVDADALPGAQHLQVAVGDRGEDLRLARDVQPLPGRDGPAELDLAVELLLAGAHGGDAQADRAVGQVHDLAWIDRIGELGDRDGDLPRVAEPVLAAQERHGAAGLELRAVVAQLADAHLRAGEVLEDRDRPARGARGVAHHAGGLRVLLDGPVGEVQPRDVHARVDHAAEGLRIAGRGADGGHDLRTAHEANVLAR